MHQFVATIVKDLCLFKNRDYSFCFNLVIVITEGMHTLCGTLLLYCLADFFFFLLKKLKI